MYAFIVGFNEWVLKHFINENGWKRTKSKDASGWEHDGQIIRELNSVGFFDYPELAALQHARSAQNTAVHPSGCAQAHGNSVILGDTEPPHV